MTNGCVDLIPLREITELLETLTADFKPNSREDAIEGMSTAATLLANHVRQAHCTGQEVPLALAHYTSLETMVAIARNGPEGYLRLTDTLHLSDPEEGRATPWATKIADALNDESWAQGWGASMFSSAYILSFVAPPVGSENPEIREIGNNLFFWRTYGNGGGGCSITFNNVRSWRDDLQSRVRRVHYDDQNEAELGKCILKLLKLVATLRTSYHDETSFNEAMEEARTDFHECFSKRFLCKKRAYQAENEYRIVAFSEGRGTAQFEMSRGQLRHYLELSELQMNNLVSTNTGVLVGPAVAHKEDVANSLGQIWKESTKGEARYNIRVGSSGINYRPE